MGRCARAYEGESVTIEERHNDEWSILTSVTTHLDGSYRFTWTPPAAGNYDLKAIWSGDSEYAEAISDVIALTITKLSSSLTCDTMTSTSVIGEQIVLSGIVDPARSGIPVTLHQQTNSGWITLNAVLTDADGKYLYVWAPSTTGTYQIRASIASDEIYSASISNSQVISVEKITPSLTCAVTTSEITLEEAVTIS
jgi:5-hydroxyisourate hydrolase-like protein (transthyretin family)